MWHYQSHHKLLLTKMKIAIAWLVSLSSEFIYDETGQAEVDTIVDRALNHDPSSKAYMWSWPKTYESNVKARAPVDNFCGKKNVSGRVRFNCFRGTYPKFSIPYFCTLPEKHKYFPRKREIFRQKK